MKKEMIQLPLANRTFKRSFFFVAFVISTCIHYSSQYCRGVVSINLIRDLIKKDTEFRKSTMNETGVDQKTISSKYLEMDDFSLQQREKTEWKCEREKGKGNGKKYNYRLTLVPV